MSMSSLSFMLRTRSKKKGEEKKIEQGREVSAKKDVRVEDERIKEEKWGKKTPAMSSQ